MTDAEYAVLSEWFNFLITCPQLDFKIDQIVYLRTDPEVAYERIKKRKRPEEHLIPFEYLKLQDSIDNYEYDSAIIVLCGDDGWTLKEYYLSNEFRLKMQSIASNVTIVSEEQFRNQYGN